MAVKLQALRSICARIWYEICSNYLRCLMSEESQSISIGRVCNNCMSFSFDCSFSRHFNRRFKYWIQSFSTLFASRSTWNMTFFRLLKFCQIYSPAANNESGNKNSPGANGPEILFRCFSDQWINDWIANNSMREAIWEYRFRSHASSRSSTRYRFFVPAKTKSKLDCFTNTSESDKQLIQLWVRLVCHP